MEKNFALGATKKMNILTLVLSEKQILNETKKHTPITLNGWSLIKVDRDQIHVCVNPVFFLSLYISRMHARYVIFRILLISCMCWKTDRVRAFHSFPVVDWFCLFIYLWVLTFPLLDCSEFGNFVRKFCEKIISCHDSQLKRDIV